MIAFSNGNSISEKEVFKKVLILELGPRSILLCKFAQELIEEVPSYFWSVGASSSGKHHPEFSNGDGGLARHSLMVYRWLRNLVETSPSDIDEYVPSMIVAALFHDCCKRGLPDNVSEHTIHEHPLLASKFIIDKAEKFIKDNKDFIEMTAEDDESFKNEIAVVVACIQSHMGKWNTSEHSTIELPRPTNSMQYMVHLADYISSKKYTTFDVEYFSNLMSK